jgi:hypothetical protein
MILTAATTVREAMIMAGLKPDYERNAGLVLPGLSRIVDPTGMLPLVWDYDSDMIKIDYAQLEEMKVRGLE